VLTERFTHLLGQPPLASLARSGLQLAARLLEATDHKVLQVAHEVGYGSEPAFNCAFKRTFKAPGANTARGSARGRANRWSGLGRRERRLDRYFVTARVSSGCVRALVCMASVASVCRARVQAGRAPSWAKAQSSRSRVHPMAKRMKQVPDREQHHS
jgi:helix-turn-helix protein